MHRQVKIACIPQSLVHRIFIYEETQTRKPDMEMQIQQYNLQTLLLHVSWKLLQQCILRGLLRGLSES